MASEQRPRPSPTATATSTAGLLPQTHQPSKSPLNPTVDAKRGANRSTKVAGKLKVLPDQPDVLPLPQQGAASKAVPIPSSQAGQSPAVIISPTIPEASSTGIERQREALGTVDEGDERWTSAIPPKKDNSASDEESGEDGDDEEGDFEELDAEVYNQIAQIPEGTARRDAMRLTKTKAKSLPRVTAYATAASYRLHEMMKFFQARKNANRTNARIIDDVIYTPYAYDDPVSDNQQFTAQPRSLNRIGDLLGIPELQVPESGLTDTEVEEAPGHAIYQPDVSDSGAEFNGPTIVSAEKKKRKRVHFDSGKGTEAEVFVFAYGTVVIWGMTEAQEKRFLSSIKRFEVERLSPDDTEMEDLNYYYANYSRIYNDVITLRRGSSHMTKLSLSHALSQSVKISVFEELISTTIEDTKDIPEIISETGKVGMPHKEIMKQIGELFLLRTNINLVGSVLDSPEVFWSYPDLQPLYDAARSYLEIPQRVNLLNTRVEVLQDMLQLLKESVSSRHSERLEQIVIALIGIEIVLGVITILVDLFS